MNKTAARTDTDGLTDEQYNEYQAIAAKHDVKARKDATINMRVSSEDLTIIKEKAKKAGYAKYQAWIHDQLINAG